MNSKHNFVDEDRAKVIKFLNQVAKHAKFEVYTDDLVDYFKSLSYMQQVLLPKIDANILEVKRVIKAEEDQQVATAEESK